MSSIEHYFLEDKNFVLTVAQGEIRDSEFIESVAFVRASDKLTDHYACIVDCRNVTSFKTPTSDAIFSASKGRFKKIEDKNRRLAVLSDSKLVYGLARMYGFYAVKAEVEIFEGLEAALEWLDLSDSLVEVAELADGGMLETCM